MKFSKVFCLVGVLGCLGSSGFAGIDLKDFGVSPEEFPATTRHLGPFLEKPIISDIEESVAAHYLQKQKDLEKTQEELGYKTDPRPELRKLAVQEKFSEEEYKEKAQHVANFTDCEYQLKKIKEKLSLFVDFKKVLIAYSKAVEEDGGSDYPHYRVPSLEIKPADRYEFPSNFYNIKDPLKENFRFFEHFIFSELIVYHMWDARYLSEPKMQKYKQKLSLAMSVLKQQLPEGDPLKGSAVWNEKFSNSAYKTIAQIECAEKTSPEKLGKATRVIEEFATPFFEIMKTVHQEAHNIKKSKASAS